MAERHLANSPRRRLNSFGLAAGLALALAGNVIGVAAESYVPGQAAAPEPVREFRAAWIATVKNIDWPSRPGLSVPEQKAELVGLLDAAKRLNMNAVLLQVRTACDALYHSNLEPWSEYLTGKMGQAPTPFYDPLGFAIQEAHNRGLELHAWFNPYRARHTSAFSPIARNHISKTRPALVKAYGSQLWLDPGNPDVQEYSFRVVMDVVTRYDIDGVHFDDYFYPYPEKDSRQQPIPFPDWSSWSRYKQTGGTLSREDWRRDNVNRFVRRIGAGIKQRKPWVKFGISPFGIWRPGFPPSIKGLDAYDQLYADSRLWMIEGLCDYFAPQLYWSTERAEQSFPVLLKWWTEQNRLKRHLWPGIAHGNGAPEIASQIRQSRQQLDADGHLHWSMKPLFQNRNGVADVLRRDLYAHPAILPAYPWINHPAPPVPQLNSAHLPNGTVRFSWSAQGSTNVSQWLVQRQHHARWATDVLGDGVLSFTLPASQCPDIVVVRAVNRVGSLGKPASLVRKPSAPSPPR